MFLDEFANPYWGLEGEDVLLKLLLRDARTHTYVDIGANHPRQYSLTYALYREGWRGILVEPNPRLVRSLKKARVGDVVIGCGVGTTVGSMPFFVFDPSAYSTFDEEQVQALKGSTNPPRLIGVSNIDVRRLDQIISEAPPAFRAASLLSIDVEGRDLDVLQSIDLNVFRPAVIAIEVLNASCDVLHAHPVTEYLAAHRYRLRSYLYHTAVYVECPRMCLDKGRQGNAGNHC